MSGHGFEVTGDPADLPPGAKMIEINLTETVRTVARALYARIQAGAPELSTEDFDKLDPGERYNLMELAHTAIMALVEEGWHSTDMHDAIKAAITADAPQTGMDPR